MADLERIKIEPSWKEVLKEEFTKPYFDSIRESYLQAKSSGAILYPPAPLLFNAFNLTPFDQVKAVILGQDPYHAPHQAMGLCFSVPKGVALPASLRNVYKELERDLGIPPAKHGDLTSWAKQGVFMLNAILSVEQGKAGSHQKFGWQTFTDAAISALSRKKKGVVFLLWGNFAREKRVLIDSTKHTILESAHPSPLAGNRYFGNGHFSKTNEILKVQGEREILWRLPE
ncbi:uracil-DNA glycosylase [Wolinella succinogenes]|nr:uracil-DNA glycosylase [Wolinella succinogenes]VEG81906.1 Uracil-DNA glycosylase [Wolinella succinogenes]